MLTIQTYNITYFFLQIVFFFLHAKLGDLGTLILERQKEGVFINLNICDWIIKIRVSISL